MADIHLGTMDKIPFQVQIFYRALNGNKMVRVITQYMDISSDREMLEKQADHEMLIRNAVQSSSKIAREGLTTEAMALAKGFNNHLKKACKKAPMDQQKYKNVEEFNEQFGDMYARMAKSKKSAVLTYDSYGNSCYEEAAPDDEMVSMMFKGAKCKGKKCG